jgi:hypothetical protein
MRQAEHGNPPKVLSDLANSRTVPSGKTAEILELPRPVDGAIRHLVAISAMARLQILTKNDATDPHLGA